MREAPAVESTAPKRGAKNTAKSSKQKVPRGMGVGARRKSTRIEARLTDAQKALFQKAAELRGQTLTEFVVQAGEEAAARVLERAGVLVLSTRDSAAFVEALLNPPAPNARLLAAARRYQSNLVEERGHRSEPRRQPRQRGTGGA